MLYTTFRSEKENVCISFPELGCVKCVCGRVLQNYQPEVDYLPQIKVCECGQPHDMPGIEYTDRFSGLPGSLQDELIRQQCFPNDLD